MPPKLLPHVASTTIFSCEISAPDLRSRFGVGEKGRGERKIVDLSRGRPDRDPEERREQASEKRQRTDITYQNPGPISVPAQISRSPWHPLGWLSPSYSEKLRR